MLGTFLVIVFLISIFYSELGYLRLSWLPEVISEKFNELVKLTFFFVRSSVELSKLIPSQFFYVLRNVFLRKHICGAIFYGNPSVTLNRSLFFLFSEMKRFITQLATKFNYRLTTLTFSKKNLFHWPRMIDFFVFFPVEDCFPDPIHEIGNRILMKTQWKSRSRGSSESFVEKLAKPRRFDVIFFVFTGMLLRTV